MTALAIHILLSGVWYVLLLVLSFVAWKWTRHWSALVILATFGIMVALRMLFMIQIFLLQPAVQASVEADSQTILAVFRSLIRVGWMFAYALGIVGALGALAALRKRGWKPDVVRSEA